MNKNHCLSDIDLSLYCTGDLSPDQRSAAERHLRNCVTCRSEVAGIRRTLAAMPKPELNLTAAEKARFSARVVQSTRRRGVFGRRQLGMTAATAVAAGLLTFIMFSPGREPATYLPVSPQITEFDLVENLDFLHDLELLEMMELLEQLEEQG